jgi:probable HAF family extracellular repeat protein
MAQSLTWLGTLSYRNSIATDISVDGSVVVGCAYNQNFDYRAFRWTQETGMQDWGDFGGLNRFGQGC